MGNAEPYESGDAALAQALLSGDDGALSRFERRLSVRLSEGFQAGLSGWGDIGLTREEFSRRVGEAAAVEILRGDKSAATMEEIVSRLDLRDLYLAAACSLGLDAAWRRFDEAFREYLRGTVRSIARTPRHCDEILAGLYADLFISRRRTGEKYPSSLGRYGGRATLKTWLRTVLFSRVQDFYERRRRLPASLQEPVAREAKPSSDWVEGEDGSLLSLEQPDHSMARRDLARQLSEILHQELSRLDPGERIAFHAYFVEGLSVEEVARMLGTHRATIGRRLRRTRDRLLREVGREVRLRTGVEMREVEGAIPDLAKQMDVDWSRILKSGERHRGG